MKRFIISIFLFMSMVNLYAQKAIHIKVMSADKMEPLIGAKIYLTQTNLTFTSDKEGNFSIPFIDVKDSLVISYVGYYTKRIAFSKEQYLKILLEPKSEELREVIVSTGYQNISSERVTGSVIQVDNELINQKVGTNIIERLENNVAGLIFNRIGTNNSNQSQISIRGQSTINGKTDPLIVLDNFAFDGSLSDINPNDIESISILKDAAAASIWGAKAGNGVIVITTKKGKFNRQLTVSLNSNVTLGNKPDLFYLPKISSGDYVEIERMLFNNGYYNSLITSPAKTALTPGVELLLSNPEDLEARLAELKTHDVRNDFAEYYYRKSFNQQHSLNLSGGTEMQRFSVSVGFDKNLDNLIKNDYKRYSLNANNTYKLWNGRLEVNSNLWYTQSVLSNPNGGISSIRLSAASPLYPYARLADENGTSVAINHDYRNGFVDAAVANGLLDWRYNPINELDNYSNKQNVDNLRAGTGINLKIIDGLNAIILYQYNKNNGNVNKLQNEESYFARNLINSFSIKNPDGSIDRPIALGGILDQLYSTTKIHNIRTQLNYNNYWDNKHEVRGIVGYEVEDKQMFTSTNRLYGYDSDHALNKPVNYLTPYISYVNPSSTTNYIPFIDGQTHLTDRFVSYYGNAMYSYLKKYSIYGSFRMDKSNLFGVSANQKGVPLWSLGLSWNINKEDFYRFKAIPDLKIRVSYGLNGNVDKSVSAYTTANYLSNAVGTRLSWAQIVNPPNPELRWEKVKTLNIGLDFRTQNSIVNGTIEFYTKRGVDLIGVIPFAPSTGITSFRGNNANTSGYGTDITLNTKNIDNAFKWRTTIIYSLINEKVTKYGVKATGSEYVQAIGYPLENRPYYSIFSYKWAGLDPTTGDPQGYLNGEVSKDYALIQTSATSDNIEFNGSARPTRYGSLRNTFSYKNIVLSANISYRLGYVFRNNSIRYADNLGLDNQHEDYLKRWQKPGDESFTAVPSIPNSPNVQRDNFYNYSEILVEKGDHIRFQDVILSYEISKKNIINSPFSKVRFYTYVNNLGIIWKKSNGKLDPDYISLPPPPKTFAIGIQADL